MKEFKVLFNKNINSLDYLVNLFFRLLINVPPSTN